MRSDAALSLQPTVLQKQTTPQRKYGERLDFAKMPQDLLCSTPTEDGYETQVYRVLCLHKNFDRLLNVVLLQRTHLASGRVGHVILFSSDLFLGAEALLDYYRLRLQIEFTFRDAKQHFGLEDFMGVKETSVANAMSLSLCLWSTCRATCWGRCAPVLMVPGFRTSRVGIVDVITLLRC